MIVIDGSAGEGGGQILRSALTLSLVTGRPFRMHDIRRHRVRPGLQPQHLAAVRAAAEVAGAEAEGAGLGSLSLRFRPGRTRAGRYRFDIGTAGAAGLLLQTVYLPLALCPDASTVIATGGTHVPQSPCFHYLECLWRPALADCGIELRLAMPRAGFYPPGGGVIEAAIEPTRRVRPLQRLARGRLERLTIVSAGARLPAHVALRQRDTALEGTAHLDVPRETELAALTAASPGSMLLILAEFETSAACFFSLGAPGKPAERVAEEAVAELEAFLATDAAVDPWLADQLLLPLALATGRSRLHTARITTHLLSNTGVIRAFLATEFDVAGGPDEPGTVTIVPGGDHPGPEGLRHG